jgi:probable phosphoglycerate mutase
MEKLILVRHGITANNAAKLIQGTLDIALSDVGCQQAEALANALSEEPFDLIVSSPQIRAYKTACVIAEGRNTPIIQDENLRERSFGLYEGGPQKTYQDDLAESGLLRWDFRPQGGETIMEVWSRCACFLQHLRTARAKHVLLAAHEAVNRCLILMILGRPVSDWTSIKQENCCINEFQFHPDGSVLRYALNKTDHLSVLV